MRYAQYSARILAWETLFLALNVNSSGCNIKFIVLQVFTVPAVKGAHIKRGGTLLYRVGKVFHISKEIVLNRVKHLNFYASEAGYFFSGNYWPIFDTCILDFFLNKVLIADLQTFPRMLRVR